MATITYLRVNLPNLDYLIKGVGDDKDLLLKLNVPTPISAERAVGWLGSPDFKVEFESGELEDYPDEKLEWYAKQSGTKVQSFRRTIIPPKKTFVQKVIKPKKSVKAQKVEEIVSEESLDEAGLADESE